MPQKNLTLWIFGLGTVEIDCMKNWSILFCSEKFHFLSWNFSIQRLKDVYLNVLCYYIATDKWLIFNLLILKSRQYYFIFLAELSWFYSSKTYLVSLRSRTWSQLLTSKQHKVGKAVIWNPRVWLWNGVMCRSGLEPYHFNFNWISLGVIRKLRYTKKTSFSTPPPHSNVTNCFHRKKFLVFALSQILEPTLSP